MYFPKTIQKKKRRKYSLCFLVLQAVVEAGARYVVVPGILPTGCIPIVLTLFASPNRSDYDARTGCLREDNAFARYHNSALLEAVRRLRCKYPAVQIVYADYYEPVMAFLKKPTAFGTRELCFVSLEELKWLEWRTQLSFWPSCAHNSMTKTTSPGWLV
jgi:hypothetical protein